MQLAKIQLKLSGNIANTVVKHNVTPPQLAIYATMHGEDCVQSLDITGTDKERTIANEMNRLRGIFKTEESTKILNRIFPGIAPQLPVTFVSIGYDPEIYGSGDFAQKAADRPPQYNQEAAAELAKRIKLEQAKSTPPGAAVPAVDPVELSDTLGHDEVDIDDDALEAELARLSELDDEDDEDDFVDDEDNLPPPPGSSQAA